MNIEEYLRELKIKYQKVEAPLHLKQSGWEELSKNLVPAPAVTRRFWLMRFAVSLGIILVVVGSLFGFYQVAAASLPGDLFYPVKRLSEKVIEETTGSNQTALDNRAGEIVDLAKQKEIKTTELKQAVEEYTQEVADTKEAIQKSGKTDQEFEKKLEEQHQEFDKVAKEAPSAAGEIRDAQEASNHSEHSGHGED